MVSDLKTNLRSIFYFYSNTKLFLQLDNAFEHSTCISYCGTLHESYIILIILKSWIGLFWADIRFEYSLRVLTDAKANNSQSFGAVCFNRDGGNPRKSGIDCSAKKIDICFINQIVKMNFDLKLDFRVESETSLGS